MRWWWVSAAILTACGTVVDEDTFLDQYPEDICQRAIACLWPDTPKDLSACMDQRRAWFDQYDDCTYDPSSGGDCIAEVRELSCDSLEYRFPDTNPGSCNFVYVCQYSTY